MEKLLLCVFVLLATCFAQPPTPKFPDEFTCDTDEFFEGEPPSFGQWYYSEKLNAQRYDSSFRTYIMNYAAKQQDTVEWHFGQRPTCQTKTLSGAIPSYSLTGYSYNGTRTFEGYSIQVWSRASGDGSDFYYCRNPDQTPVGFERTRGGRQVSFRVFRNFDLGPQDPNLFNASYVAPGDCTRNVPEKEAPRMSYPEPNPLQVLPGCAPVESCATMRGIVDRHFSADKNDMLCIAFYESSYCPGVYNGLCCYGLWQINRNHLGEAGCPSSVSALYNPDTNADCARHVLDTQGLRAWSTWDEGDCDRWSRCTV